MTVDSKPGKGTTFHFTGCFEKSEGVSDAVCEYKEGTSLLTSGLAGLRVLLAEDNPLNQKMGQIILERSGLSVNIVSNGKEALEAVRTGRYGFVLMDIQMPEMDGAEAAKMIRKEGFQNPIIALTANVTAEALGGCHNSGINGYIDFQIINLGALSLVEVLLIRLPRSAFPN